MKVTNRLFGILVVALCFAACSNDKIIDVNHDSYICFESDSILISMADANQVVLPVLVCAAPHTQKIDVDFEFAGKGLENEIDFTIDKPGSLDYPVGQYNDTIKLNFLSPVIGVNEMDTITIQLTSNSAGYLLGYPGPDHLHQQVRIFVTD